ILDGATIPVYDKPEQNAWRHWAMGLAYAAKGQQDRAKAMLDAMKKSVDAVTSATEPLLIGTIELEATIAARGGNHQKGFDLFKKAADREAAMLYTEPPSYPRPVTEAYGNVALAVGEYAAAEKAYRLALDQEPGSGRAYFGLASALEQLVEPPAAAEMRGRGLKAWIAADADLPQLRQARASTAAQQH